MSANLGKNVDGKKVAIVGSGISGLGAAWLLHRSGFDVTVYESEATCGGHTLTDETEEGSPVDLGFQVFNLTTYPNLVELFHELGVESSESDMSFGLSINSGALEWASHDLGSVFAQKGNALSPSFLRMLYNMLSFNAAAPKVLGDDHYRDVTLGQYLKQHKYPDSFAYSYLLPMCAAIWSVPNASVLDFPVQTVVAFMQNHHMLTVTNRPQWRVVKNRSREYVDKICDELRGEDGEKSTKVRTSTAVTSIARGDDGVVITDSKGNTERFDQVVLATHTDVSLAILGHAATDEEKQVLGAIPYQANDVYLHKDKALMPKSKKAWASWNVLAADNNDNNGDDAPVCVTYWVNSLQHVQDGVDRFVTLNPSPAPADETVIRRLELSHPSFSFAARTAQERLPAMQGKNRTWFAGAWAGWGFHEDGLKSGIAVAKGLGATVPWTPRPLQPHIPFAHSLAIKTFAQVGKELVKKGRLQIVLPNGKEMVFGQSDAERPKVRCTLRVLDTKFFIRAVKDMDVGLGESYMAGEYVPSDLTAFLLILTMNMENYAKAATNFGVLNMLGSFAQSLYHMSRANTLAGSKKNIQEHYDLGNDMYRLFLDETLSYSSGIFKTKQDSLYQSQLNKIDALVAKCNVKPGEHILEIGCGWGAFAIRAVQSTGCKVTGVTISHEQFDEATARVKAAGLEDSIKIVFSDYRELPERYGPGYFDHAVSCEMIEAVGHENLPTYFGILSTMIRVGGHVVIQAITTQDQNYHGQLQGQDFIKRHIFPGSVLPSMQIMKDLTHGPTALEMDQVEDIGLDYAVTLKMWHERWCEQESAIKALGHSDAFFKKWRFYFSYCEAAFEAQYIHNYQISWVKRAGGKRVYVPKAGALPATPLVRIVKALGQKRTWFALAVGGALAVVKYSPETVTKVVKATKDVVAAVQEQISA